MFCQRECCVWHRINWAQYHSSPGGGLNRVAGHSWQAESRKGGALGCPSNSVLARILTGGENIPLSVALVKPFDH